MNHRSPTSGSDAGSVLRLVAVGIGTLVLAGCVTSRVEEFLSEQPVMTGDDAVVILTNRQDAVVETEESFSDCIYSQLRRGGGSINIVTEDEFKDAIFPWFEPRLAPAKAEAVALLMENPLIARRISELNVRYLVWIHGESEMLNKQGLMTCTLSPAGGGCLGILSWDNNSAYEASIWDVREGHSLGIISAEATGTSVVPALGLPIPMIARTKTASCRSLGEQLKNALTGA